VQAQVFSLYWDNVEESIVSGQRAVFDCFGLPISQHRIHGLPHGEWMDWVVKRFNAVDVFLFIDIDCVPLAKSAIEEAVKSAANGHLHGAAQAAAHIDNSRIYAGPFFLAVSATTLKHIGYPSAVPDTFHDVAQRWTEAAVVGAVPVEVLMPSSVEVPRWTLPNGLAFGIGTNYEDRIYHLFESRASTEAARFHRVVNAITAQQRFSPLAAVS